jgi:hypothetical protein
MGNNIIYNCLTFYLQSKTHIAVLVLLHLLAFVYVVVVSASEVIEEGKPVVGCWLSDVLVAGRCL